MSFEGHPRHSEAMTTRVLGLLASSVLMASVSCGGSRLEAKTSAPLHEQSEGLELAQLSQAPLENVSTPITQLERKDVLATIDAGLGRFLQKFDMEPSLTPAGEFSGFRIVRIHDADSFQGLGIGPGDIITSINQHPIERPTEAYEAFIGLRTAEALDIDYVRGGRSMRLSLPIVGSAESAKSPASKVPRSDQKSTRAPASVKN